MRNAILAGLVVSLSASSAARADVFTNVTEVSGDPDWVLAYDLAIPTVVGAGGHWNNAAVPYTTDNTSSIGNFDRVAYYVELGGATNANRPNGWVYVSFDRLAGMTAANKVGVPNVASGEFYQQNVANMNVAASGNLAGTTITTGTGIQTGNIEFWPSNYNMSNGRSAGNGGAVPNASASSYDFGDGGAGTGSGHGSMQVHNYDLDGAGSGTAGQTIFGFSKWGNANVGGEFDLGIGNSATTNARDWTNEQNTLEWTTRRMQILVHVPEPSTAALALAAGALLATRRRRGRVAARG